MARLPSYTRLSREIALVTSISQVKPQVSRLLASKPRFLGFDLEFNSAAQVALIQLSSPHVTCLFHVARFRGVFFIYLV